MLEATPLPAMTAQRRAERRERIAASVSSARAHLALAQVAVRRAVATSADRLGALLAWTFSAAVVAVVLLLLATACVVAGVYLLSGLPWALLAAGGILFALAALLLRGLANG